MPSRETFWNIPHWAETGHQCSGLPTIVAVGYGAFPCARRWRVSGPAMTILPQTSEALHYQTIPTSHTLTTTENQLVIGPPFIPPGGHEPVNGHRRENP